MTTLIQLILNFKTMISANYRGYIKIEGLYYVKIEGHLKEICMLRNKFT